MKAIKLLLSVFALAFVVSCSNDDNYPPVEPIDLYQLLAEYEVWFVDYSRSSGTGDVPYVAQAFTLSFLNGVLYANNNLVGIGATGNGLGIDVGTYSTHNMTLRTNHIIDGLVDFEVLQMNTNTIEIYNYAEDVSYILEGFQTSTFDYDGLFYDNLDLFVQEYDGWEKTYVSEEGDHNPFDDENYLAFFFDNGLIFESSLDGTGIDIGEVEWHYGGFYNISIDAQILTLDYDGGDTEKFDLTVLNDDKVIELYHISSGTTYQFTGRGFNLKEKRNLRKKESTNKKETVRRAGQKRTNVESRITLGEKYLK